MVNKMTKLILVRHGESIANHNHYFAGQTDVDLYDTGFGQANCTAKFVADNYKIDKIYSSDLLRAFNTAKPLGELLSLPIETNVNLREIFAGDWEAKDFDYLQNNYKAEYETWMNDIGAAVCPNGESVEALKERVVPYFQKLANENEGKTLAIATHATVIRSFMTYIKYGSIENMKAVPWVTNASVTEVEYENGKFSLGKVSEDKHLGEIKTHFPSNV